MGDQQMVNLDTANRIIFPPIVNGWVKGKGEVMDQDTGTGQFFKFLGHLMLPNGPGNDGVETLSYFFHMLQFLELGIAAFRNDVLTVHCVCIDLCKDRIQPFFVTMGLKPYNVL